jgi:hypothetical protein
MAAGLKTSLHARGRVVISRHHPFPRPRHGRRTLQPSFGWRRRKHDAFEIMASRGDDKRGVIIRIILGPQARCTVVRPARFDGRNVEGVDLSVICEDKTYWLVIATVLVCSGLLLHHHRIAVGLSIYLSL